MAFGSAAVDTSELKIDGVTFQVKRMTNKLRRELNKINKSQAPITVRLNQKREFVFNHLVAGWAGMSQKWRQERFVSNETHFASRSCDVDGDKVEIARATFEETNKHSEAVLDGEYESRAEIAIDKLLMTSDAPIIVNGKRKKLNPELRQEIKRDDKWEASIVVPIWQLATAFQEFFKDESVLEYKLEDEFEFNKANVGAIVGSYEDYGPGESVTWLIEQHANSVDAFKQQQIEKDCEAGKR